MKSFAFVLSALTVASFTAANTVDPVHIRVDSMADNDASFHELCDKHGRHALANPTPRACFETNFNARGKLWDGVPAPIEGVYADEGKKFMIYANAKVTLTTPPEHGETTKREIHITSVKNKLKSKTERDAEEEWRQLNGGREPPLGCTNVIIYRFPGETIETGYTWCPGQDSLVIV